MKIALFQPRVPDLNTTPPLGPLYLASVLEQEGFEVLLFDERIDFRHVLQKIENFHPDILGVSAVTAAYPRGLEVSNALKKGNPHLRVAFGGPHPSALPLSVMGEDVIDYVIIGEGERTFLSLCKAIRDKNDFYDHLKNIKNLAFKDNNKKPFVTEKDNLFTDEELNSLPYPAFHLMDLDNYFKGSQTHGIYQKGSRILPMMTTRGCPFTCTFCCRVMGSTVRKRSIQNVVREIEELIRKYQIDELYIEDDNFTIDKNRAIELLDRIKKTGIKYLKFANGLNINTVDEEMLKRMKEAGVYSVSFGIESGCPDTLKKMKKYFDLTRTRKIIFHAKSLGLLVGANCIIGYPGETLDDIRNSLNYFLSLHLDSMAIVNLVPFPGTEVRKLCEEKAYLTEEAKHYDDYYFYINNPIPLIETPWLSKTQLIHEIKRAYRKMYFNIPWFLKAIKNVSFKKILFGIKLFFIPKSDRKK